MIDPAIAAIWGVLFLVSVFAPMRWSLAAFLCLSAMDVRTGRTGIGTLNLVKGVAVPAFLLWRLRRYAGPGLLPAAPVAWLLLASYAAIAASWSLFPGSAYKLVVQMLASFLIFCVFARAARGGYLTPATAIWAAAGCLAIALIRSAFFPAWADDPSRFTGFLPAQAFAALLAACYCIVLCGKGLRAGTRLLVCPAIAAAIVVNGSRIWFIGIVIGTLLNFLISRARVWMKLATFASAVILLAFLIGSSGLVLHFIATGANDNRIAAAVTALQKNDRQSTGLGTLNFRRLINKVAIERIANANAVDLIFGRGTCNGAMISASLFPRLYKEILDPNRMMHNEWLRALYEWGLTGASLWLLFIASTLRYAIDGVRIDPLGNARPLLIYLPGFLLALAGENIIAGAATAANMGFIFAAALSTMPHREFLNWKLARSLRLTASRKHALFSNPLPRPIRPYENPASS